MVHMSVLAKYLVLFLSIAGEVCPAQFANLKTRGRSPLQVGNIIQGLLRSGKIIRYISEIPCDIINTLENDADEAKNFIRQFESGEVPTLIKDLPQEVVGAFKDTVGIFLTLPSELISAAEAAVTDAAKIFNDIGSGAIVSDIENIPGVVVSDVTSAWGDFTTGLESDWNAATHAIACFFNDCPINSDTGGSCSGSTQLTASATQGSSTTLSSAAPAPYPTPPVQTSLSSTISISPSNASTSTRLLTQPNASPSTRLLTQPNASPSTRFLTQPSMFQLCWLVVLGLAGIVLVL